MGIAMQRAAGDTDPGRVREVNEDRFHVDATRGLFMVVDGIGGQAAGGKAADIAIAMLRKRLERETGPVPERIREAIAVANNEIFRVASQRPEWHGMACVLTVAVVDGDHAVVGHVGDTRLYKLRHDRIEKITRDHSPVGEREDADELSESEAMRHPRRNEVYRDVGSESHDPGDPEFVDIQEVAFEADAALLLCSDGLSDLLPAATIAQIVTLRAGDVRKVARALVDAANDGGGKDNVTVVYVEGEQFARRSPAATTRRGVSRFRVAAAAIFALGLGVALGWTLARQPHLVDGLTGIPAIVQTAEVVNASESIMAAIARAQPGSEVIVEPGEYREQLVLKDHIRLVSRVPRGATLRLPTTASESEAAVVASELSRAEISGFRIVGDAATPLGTGILVRNSALAIVDVEISGASSAAVDFSGEREATLVGSEIRENPGAAMAVRTGAGPRITQNSFLRNGLSDRSMNIEAGARPQMYRNLFHGITVDVFSAMEQAARQSLVHDNLFLGTQTPSASRRTGQDR